MRRPTLHWILGLAVTLAPVGATAAPPAAEPVAQPTAEAQPAPAAAPAPAATTTTTTQPPAATTTAPAPATVVTAPATVTIPVDKRVVQLDTLFEQAQRLVAQYNQTHDPKDLVVADELLTQWHKDHASAYGYSAAAMKQRHKVEQQQQLIRAELQRVQGVAPTPTPVVPVAPAADNEVPPNMAPPVDPVVAKARKEARQWTRGGIALLSVGVVTTFAVATPLWVARNNALHSASQARYRVDQIDDVAAARRRQTGAIVTFSIGAPIAALGIAMTTVGIVKHVKARRMTVTPTAGLHYGGATLTLRF